MKNGMKISGVVADTSIWIKFFNKPDSEEKLRLVALMRAEQLFLTGVEVAELLQGVRSDKEQAEVLSCITALPFLNHTLLSWIKIGQLSSLIRKQGITVPLSDIMIASIAMENDCEVFTLDKHFKSIPAVRLHTLQHR